MPRWRTCGGRRRNRTSTYGGPAVYGHRLPAAARSGRTQKFEYGTNIGFGIGVAGGGESTGERADGGERPSALRFWSDDPVSLISDGSGYWKYVPEDGGGPFLAGYNYDTRLGRLGRTVDHFLLRPLMV